MEQKENKRKYGERTPEELRQDINAKADELSKIGKNYWYGLATCVALIAVTLLLLYFFNWGILYVVKHVTIALLIVWILCPLAFLVLRPMYNKMRQAKSAQLHLQTSTRFIKIYQTLYAFGLFSFWTLGLNDSMTAIMNFAVIMFVLIDIVSLFIWIKPYGIKGFTSEKHDKMMEDIKELDEYSLDD